MNEWTTWHETCLFHHWSSPVLRAVVPGTCLLQAFGMSSDSSPIPLFAPPHLPVCLAWHSSENNTLFIQWIHYWINSQSLKKLWLVLLLVNGIGGFLAASMRHGRRAWFSTTIFLKWPTHPLVAMPEQMPNLKPAGKTTGAPGFSSLKKLDHLIISWTPFTSESVGSSL